MSVFVDTSALYACMVGNDRVHDEAAATMRLLLQGGHPLHTSSYVLVETMALLQARAGLQAALDFEAALRPRLQVDWVDAELHGLAAHRMAARGARQVSFVDCVGFVLMEQLGLRRAFAYDLDFEREGFVLLTRPEQV